MKGDLIAVVMYAMVSDVNGDTLNCVDVDSKLKFDVHGKELIGELFSADSFRETKKVNLTTMADILITSHNIPFTVVYKKQNGDMRRLRGRLISSEQNLGRVMVEDLDLDSARIRQVDLRTLESLIVKGVRY